MDHEYLFRLYSKLFERHPLQTMDVNIDILEYLSTHASGDLKSKVDFNLGITYYNNFEFNQTENLFVKYLDTNRPQFHDYLISSAIKQKKYSVATKYIEKSKEIWDLNPDALLHQARIYELNEKLDDLEDLFSNYLEEASSLAIGHYLFGLYQSSHRKDLIKAKKHFEVALDILPDDKYRNRYNIFETSEDLQSKIIWKLAVILTEFDGVTSALEFANGKIPKVSFDRLKATLLIEEELLQEAEKHIINIICDQTNPYMLHHYISLLGEIYLKTHQLDQGKKNLKESISMGENLLDPYIHDYVYLAKLLELQMNDSSKEYLKKANELDSLDSRNFQIQINFSLQEWQSVISLVDSINNQYFPIEAFRLLGYCSYQLGFITDAIQNYENLLNYQPNNFSAMFELATIYKEIGDENSFYDMTAKIQQLDGLPGFKS